MEEKIGKLALINIKNVYCVKDTVKTMKTQTTGWEVTFAKHLSDERLASKI